MWSKVMALASWVEIGLQKLISIGKVLKLTTNTPKPPMSCEKQMEALLKTHKAVF